MENMGRERGNLMLGVFDGGRKVKVGITKKRKDIQSESGEWTWRKTLEESRTGGGEETGTYPKSLKSKALNYCYSKPQLPSNSEHYWIQPLSISEL